MLINVYLIACVHPIPSLEYFTNKLSQLMRLWYLSHRWPAKAQASLRICAVSSEPLLFAHLKYGSKRRVQPKIRPHWMAAHVPLKNEFTEDEKYHNLMSWSIYILIWRYCIMNMKDNCADLSSLGQTKILFVFPFSVLKKLGMVCWY